MALVRELVQAGLYKVAAAIMGSGSVANTLTAAGSTQATALAFPNASVLIFTTVAASTGVILPVGDFGDVIEIDNRGANALSVYPPIGGAINAIAANSPFSQTSAKNAFYKCISADGLTWTALLSA